MLCPLLLPAGTLSPEARPPAPVVVLAAPAPAPAVEMEEEEDDFAGME
jgi:hypothetical protein